MLVQEIIRRKRDGAELAASEIGALVGAIADGSASEGQLAAFAMAVFCRGMSAAETVALTHAMAHSGATLDWSGAGFAEPLLDKHSSGGVGDKVSLLLAPLLAACGARVPMISGRGLGHTGGTLDKLDAIPGYDSRPERAAFERAVDAAGCAIIGASADLAPADQRLYAVRDVTATVESMPLITASILSKKIAAGVDALVMDVKTGSGAFAATLDEARALAQRIVDVANGAGLPTTALITDMNQVLGRSAGNALEVAESVAALTGVATDARLMNATLAVGAELLVLGGICDRAENARAKLESALASGAAAERFGAMVAVLGGPADFVERFADYLPSARVTRAVYPNEGGHVRRMDVRAIGIAIVALGGGRRVAADRIDPSVGLTEVCGLGEAVDAEHPIALVHASDESKAEAAAAAIREAVTVGDGPTTPAPVVIERVPA